MGEELIVRSEREDDPGRTATAAASAAAVAPADAVAATLGRYRLERELGAGAMGVVHAAFDPDLERRVALKVLRSASASLEAKDRLMREARAMARLSHANVVTVHEVGTVAGRDYVAMELVHGETLAEWLRAARRPPAAILEAFLAAGRGLAAAHAAGIVHRDFKPHNVLRSRDGRIVVTDFGLARQAEGSIPAALDATLPGGQASATSSRSTPSALAGITVTGSLLGTPAYMAPEQWTGGQVTPATDQFAYCVALWEALAGERPYRGPTFDDLRTQVARGPMALDASRIPRRVRGLLRRGLDPDPDRRWPSMDALLAQLGRARRRPGVAIALAGGALTAAAVLVLALRPAGAPAAPCEPPRYDVAAIWSPAIAAELRAATSEAHAAVLAAAARGWQTARATACTAPPQVRLAQLRCLDGVLARFDVLRRAFARVPGAAAEELQAELIDPGVCGKPTAEEVPRLILAPTSDVIAAYALVARSTTDVKPTDREVTALSNAPVIDPCARILATIALERSSWDIPGVRDRMARAIDIADQCRDERLRADLLIRDAPYHMELPIMGPRGAAAIERAVNAAARVMQPDLEAELALQRSHLDARRGHWDKAFQLAGTALAAFRARGLIIRQARAVVLRNVLRLWRAEPRDLTAIAEDVATWRPVAIAHHHAEIARRLDVLAAMARFQQGDVAAAHADMVRLMQAQPRAGWTAGAQRITGEVVDEHGHPVAGARVATGIALTADSAGIGLPEFLTYNGLRDDNLRLATSDDRGRFTIEGVAPTAVIAAELGARRSQPMAVRDRVTLALEPTRHVSGKVELGDTLPTRVQVIGATLGEPTRRLVLIAPVAPDGSFTIAGAPVTALRIGVSLRDGGEFDAHLALQTLPASPAAVSGLVLKTPASSRTLDVVVRSTIASALDGAYVTLLAGRHTIRSMEDAYRWRTGDQQLHLAMPVLGDDVPGPVRGKVRSGDLTAHFDHAWPGELTVCAGSYAGDLLDPATPQRTSAQLARFAIRCKLVEPSDALVTLEVPPQPRLE